MNWAKLTQVLPDMEGYKGVMSLQLVFLFHYFLSLMANFNGLKQGFTQHKNRILVFLIEVFCPLVIFAFLAWGVVSEKILAWDKSISFAVHSIHNSALDIFAVYLTQLGIYWGVVPLMTALIIIYGFRKRWRIMIYLIITAMGSTLLSYNTKIFFARMRPRLWDSIYHLPKDYSFPSGHALSSMMLLVVLLVLTRNSRWFPLVLVLGGLFVLGIGWTRVYLGVHYFSDILAGWMLAIAFSLGLRLFILN